MVECRMNAGTNRRLVVAGGIAGRRAVIRRISLETDRQNDSSERKRLMYRSLTTRLLGLGAAAALALAAATAPLAAGSLVSTGDQVLANGSHPGQSGPNGPGNGGSADGSGNGNPGKSGPGNS